MIRLSQIRQIRAKPAPKPPRLAVVRRMNPTPNVNLSLLDDHLQIVAQDFGVSVAALAGPCRMAMLSRIRQEFCRRAVALGFSTTQIGRTLNRDHTSICYLLGSLQRKPSWTEV